MVPNFRTVDFISTFFETCPEAKAAKAGTLSAADLPFLKNLILIDKTHPDSFFGWNQILAMGDHVAFAELRQREAGLAFDEPINIQYTSGTTGHPKGAVLSHHNIVNNALLVAECMRIAPGDRICLRTERVFTGHYTDNDRRSDRIKSHDSGKGSSSHRNQNH